MKIRTGFVSNSSSSSFLIGLGKVKDKDMIKEVAEDVGMSDWDYEFIKYSPMDGNIKVESFMYNEIEMTDKVLSDGDEVIMIKYYGDEGDDFFMINDWIDYDSFDYEDFPTGVVDFVDKIGPYVEGLEIEWGAGRNG